MKKECPTLGLGHGLSALIRDKGSRRAEVGNRKETVPLVRGLSALLGVSENKEKGNV